MRIMNNVSSLNAWRNLTSTDGSMGKNLERLSSGFRINRAADDVAGLAISENMRAQIRGFNQAVRNAQDGISLLQTAEGALNETHAMLQRMRELAVQAANGTLQPEDRTQIQTEMDNLTKEVTRITNATKFNNKDLIDGSLKSGNIDDITLQIGPNGGQTVTFGIGAMDAKSLGISRDVLTGVVDNGTPGAAVVTVNTAGHGFGTGSSSVASIGNSGAGVSDPTKQYRLVSVAGGDTTLEGSTDGGSTWSAIGGAAAFSAGGNATVGTGTETFDITFAGAAAAGTQNITLSTTATPGAGGPTVVDSVGTVGAGMHKGQYQVQYDETTQKVQLIDMAGEAIGDAVDFQAGKTITIGDKNTAQTLQVTLLSNAPPATITDTLTIGSSVGRVTGDETNAILNGGRGVVDVGSQLGSGTYRIAFDGTDVQLQTSTGQAIGLAKTYAANSTIELGDPVTGRTVTIRTGANATPDSGFATIEITNNGQSAENATFNGGSKLTDARVFAGLNVSSVQGASEALGIIDSAIEKVSTQRAQLGAIQNRLEHTINNLQVVSENLVASESRIRDVDMAQEMATFTKHQILMQAGTAMLAQANAKNQAVLSLLQ